MNGTLHPAQNDVYTDQILNIESPHYNVGLYIKLKGRLHKKKLQEAINSSTKVFDVFKMRFDSVDPDKPFYIANGNIKLEMKELDFSDHINPDKVAKSWMQDRFNTTFTLHTKNVLSEQFLIKISDTEHWFFFRFHHLITDAYGLVIWVNYIARKYKSLINKENFEISHPSYIDETIKAAKYKNSADYESDDRYWKDKISKKAEPLLKKNLSFKTKPVKKSGNYFVNLSKEQGKLLDEVIKVTKSNLQQLTIAALLIYFGKVSDQSEIIFGVPVHKRGSGELINIVGMFSGILPFKGFFKEDIKLKDLLKSIADTRKEDYSHQNYFIGDLIRSLKINASEGNLYDTVINYVPFNFQLNFGEEIQPQIFWLQSEYEMAPLQVCWRDYGNQQPLELGLHYGLHYFSPTEIEFLAQRIIFILNQFAGAAEKNLGSIEIIPFKERELLNQFNNTFADYPKNKTAVDLFEERVLKSFGAIAVMSERNNFTYNELNTRSNQLGHFLRKRGVKEEVMVPMFMERSVEMLVAILGILKAGGAYVPVDPDYPAERIQFILEDIKATFIVSSRLMAQKLINTDKGNIVELDAVWHVISKEPTTNIQTSVTPYNLAYAIYTSGSTGKPKGVLIEHKGLVNFCKALTDALQLTPGLRTMQFASIGFDVSVEEIFSTLLSGGTLVIPKKEDILSIERFQEFVAKYKIEKVTLPPSYQTVMKDALGTIKTIISAGESINAAVAKYIQSKGVWLINGYGPTENTISVSISANPVNDNESNIIGKPFSNVQVHIMDRKHKVLPIGSVGEICVAGVQVARGYLNRPELTAEKFIADPFSKDANARIYRTGDLGRWLPDGNLEYFGRMDNQVKIRGFRIELEEIENVLHQSNLVGQAVVLANLDKEGNQRLVCYIAKNELFNQEKLTDYLKSKLPDFMIPALWIKLDNFPLSSNGKIDKKALPEPTEKGSTNNLFAAPRNELEAKLIALWENLLHVKKVSVYDHFFDLGGNSLLAIRLIAQIKKETGKSLLINYFLENPTVDKLAKLLSEDKKDSKNDILIPIKKSGKKIPFYIVCGAGGTAFHFYEFSDMLDSQQPVYILQQPANMKNPEEFPDTIEDIAANYIKELLIENPNGPYALSGHCLGGIIAFEMAKQLEAMGKTVKFLAMFDTIVSKKEKQELKTFKNLFSIPSGILKYISKVYLKLDFETFLFRKHTRHAFRYKINSIKSLTNRVCSNKQKDNDLEDFRTLERKYQIACTNYRMTHYNGEIVVFYAKEHYYFTDKNKNISYKKIDLDDTVKNRWKQYGSNVKVYDIEGEHSSIFNPTNAKEFVDLLRHHLNM